SLALAPVFRAQDQSSLTRITPVPADAEYTVDGQTYRTPSSAVWPAGSKHTLNVPNPIQYPSIGTKYVFRTWDFAGGVLPYNPLIVSAGASFPEYRALFDVLYGLAVSFYPCADSVNCPGSPGTVYVNGAPYNGSGNAYLAANSVAVLQAFPNPGYVFLGWQ